MRSVLLALMIVTFTMPAYGQEPAPGIEHEPAPRILDAAMRKIAEMNAMQAQGQQRVRRPNYGQAAVGFGVAVVAFVLANETHKNNVHENELSGCYDYDTIEGCPDELDAEFWVWLGGGTVAMILGVAGLQRTVPASPSIAPTPGGLRVDGRLDW